MYTGLEAEPLIAEQKEKNLHLSEGAGNKGTQKSADVSKGETRDELAKIAGVSHDTIARVRFVSKPVLKTEECRIYKVGSNLYHIFSQFDIFSFTKLSHFLFRLCIIKGPERPDTRIYANVTTVQNHMSRRQRR